MCARLAPCRRRPTSLLLAAALAGVLGIERELSEQPAGFRTHMLVGVGAALFAIVSAFGFQSIAGHGPVAVVRADITHAVNWTS